jgi:hypothetical protein
MNPAPPTDPPDISAATTAFRPEANEDRRHQLAAQILRDYAELGAWLTGEYDRLGSDYPGGAAALVRQRALLDRERCADLGEVLTPAELEEVEMRVSAAGLMVDWLLEGTVASADQRVVVFRAERKLEDALVALADPTPGATRFPQVVAGAQAEGEVRAALGDELFFEWLRRRDVNHAHFAALLERHQWSAEAELNLWRFKNEFLEKTAEMETLPAAGADSRRATLAEWGHTRLAGILGPAAVQEAGEDVANWLQGRPLGTPPLPRPR